MIKGTKVILSGFRKSVQVQSTGKQIYANLAIDCEEQQLSGAYLDYTPNEIIHNLKDAHNIFVRDM